MKHSLRVCSTRLIGMQCSSRSVSSPAGSIFRTAFVYRGIEANITESSFHASRRNLTSLFLDNEVFQFLVCSDVSVSVLTALLGVDIDLSGVIVVTAVGDQFANGRGGVLNSSTLQFGCL